MIPLVLTRGLSPLILLLLFSGHLLLNKPTACFAAVNEGELISLHLHRTSHEPRNGIVDVDEVNRISSDTRN